MSGKMDKLDELHPRIRLSLGFTLPTDVPYKVLRAEAGVEVDKPVGMSAEETYDWLEDRLIERLQHALDKLQEAIDGGE